MGEEGVKDIDSAQIHGWVGKDKDGQGRGVYIYIEREKGNVSDWDIQQILFAE